MANEKANEPSPPKATPPPARPQSESEGPRYSTTVKKSVAKVTGESKPK